MYCLSMIMEHAMKYRVKHWSTTDAHQSLSILYWKNLALLYGAFSMFSLCQPHHSP